VLDNYGTHTTPRVVRWFARHPRYQLHFTPTSGSWVNQVERWFAEITEKRIRRGSFTSVPSLEKAIQELVLYRERSGGESFGDDGVTSAGAFSIQPLEGSRFWNGRAMGFEWPCRQRTLESRKIDGPQSS
jgi:hypothetical protein